MLTKIKPYIFTFSASLIIMFFLVSAWNEAFGADSPAEKIKTENVAENKDSSLIDMFKTGGVMMYPLVLCSFAVIGLIVYHILEISEKKMAPEKDINALRKFLYDKDTVSAFRYCEENPSVLANAFSAGVLRLNSDAADKGKPSAEIAIGENIDNQETRMGFWLNLLSVIAAISPMIGLLGTVSGMIKAFRKIGLGGMGKPEQLAGDIGEALITTASGLIVGIPAMLAFFIFRGKLDSLLTKVTESITELIDLYTGEGIARQAYEARAPITPAPAPVAETVQAESQDPQQ